MAGTPVPAGRVIDPGGKGLQEVTKIGIVPRGGVVGVVTVQGADERRQRFPAVHAIRRRTHGRGRYRPGDYCRAGLVVVSTVRLLTRRRAVGSGPSMGTGTVQRVKDQ